MTSLNGKTAYLLLLATYVLALQACAQTSIVQMQALVPPEPCPLWDGGGRDRPSKPRQKCLERHSVDRISPPRPSLADPDYFTASNLQRQFAFEMPEGVKLSEGERPHSWGLALAGGGSKAASYAMGVLEALYDNEVLQQDIGAISSVSGGGYAAYWYYSRLADAYLGNPRILTEKPNFQARTASTEQMDTDTAETYRNLSFIFSECLPARYAGLLQSTSPLTEPAREPCPDHDLRWVEDRGPDDRDILRFQNHLRGYADVLSGDFDMEGGEKYKTELTQTLGWTLDEGSHRASTRFFSSPTPGQGITICACLTSRPRSCASQSLTRAMLMHQRSPSRTI